MSKITATKLDRVYEEIEYKTKQGKERKITQKRDHVLPAKSHDVRCLFCKMPMHAGVGQVVKYHAACRRQFSKK